MLLVGQNIGGNYLFRIFSICQIFQKGSTLFFYLLGYITFIALIIYHLNYKYLPKQLF